MPLGDNQYRQYQCGHWQYFSANTDILSIMGVSASTNNCMGTSVDFVLDYYRRETFSTLFCESAKFILKFLSLFSEGQMTIGDRIKVKVFMCVCVCLQSSESILVEYPCTFTWFIHYVHLF